ncbi:MAG: hypothetical protein Ct9H300mP1_04040 [Planctomycetaceae bacterium]|nr:MAG: hypothetical protein Ct9H300mP1_04040 [Planctomycetaceae bacterium]
MPWGTLTPIFSARTSASTPTRSRFSTWGPPASVGARKPIWRVDPSDRSEPVAPVVRDGLHQRIEDRFDREDLLLTDTQQVVVVGRPLDDRGGGIVQVGGLIDQNRGISRAGHDGPFATGQRGPSHSRTAGDHQQPHPRCSKMALAVSSVGSLTIVTRFSIPIASLIARLNRLTPSRQFSPPTDED